jgi:hypothetical protein
MRQRLRSSSLAMAAATASACACIAFFCAIRNVSADEKDPIAIKKLNERMEEASKLIQASQQSFEKFSYEPAIAAASLAAHQESQREMDERRDRNRAWKRETHGLAAAGGAMCALAAAQCLFMWNHLWPVDRCREVLRARGRAEMPRAVGSWRFAAPPILFAAGFACVAIVAAAQWRERDANKRQRNAFALYAATALLAVALATIAIGAAFARDASVVVAWVRAERRAPRAARAGDPEETSVCRSVAREIQNLSIQP